MSETKHEIPAPMLDAATAAILRAQEFGTGEDEPGYTRENFKRLSLYPAWQQAERYAEAALEAAGMAEMAARIAELEASNTAAIRLIQFYRNEFEMHTLCLDPLGVGRRQDAEAEYVADTLLKECAKRRGR